VVFSAVKMCSFLLQNQSYMAAELFCKTQTFMRLSLYLSPVISKASKLFLDLMHEMSKKNRPYNKVSAEVKATIAKYAIKNGKCIAVKKYEKSLKKKLMVH